MQTSDFDYNLPPEMIAQVPIEPRDSARLLLLDRHSGEMQHAIFHDLPRFLRPGDLLVLNETRVISARLFGRKSASAGRVELLLVRKLAQQDEPVWEVLVGGKRLRPGVKIEIQDGPQAEIMAELDGPRRVVRFSQPVEPYLVSAGHVPLPPYIHASLADPERYQTVYASAPGSVAAPTAGLHFTPRLLQELAGQGIHTSPVLLHIGLDTFAPVNEDDPKRHQIHTEWCQVPVETVNRVNAALRNGGRVIAVGTTSVRALESAAGCALPGEAVGVFEGPTDLFILPGYTFKVVSAMVTNFHLPRSTLIMLVSAFAGRERVLQAYAEAMRHGYRFYSFGDAMLIL